jgi:prepilin-type processing-associated H-X9-DG protein
MRASHWRIVGGGALVLALAAGARAQEPVLVDISVRGISRLAAAVAEVTGAVGEPVAADEVRGHLGALLGSPDLAGLDADGIFRAVVPAGDWMGEGAPPAVLYAPVTGDGSAYMQALGASMQRTGEENGVVVFQAAPGGMPPVLCVRLVPGFAVLGMDPAVVAAAGPAPQADAEAGVPGVVAIRCHVPALLQMLEPKLEVGLAEMNRITEAAQQAEADGAAPAGMPGMDPAKILKLEADYGMRLLRQVDVVGLGVDLQGGTVRLHTRVAPAEGSVFAQELAKARPPLPGLAHAVPPGALLAEVGYVPGIDPLMTGYAQFARELYDSMGEGFAGLGEMLSAMMESLEGVYTGDFLIAVVPGVNGRLPAFVQVMGIRDPAAVRDMMQKGIEMVDDLSAQESFQQIYKTYRIEEVETRPYRGGEIQTFAMHIEMADAMAGQMPPAFTNFLGNLRYDMALLDNMVMFTLGDAYPIEKAVDAVLDQPYPEFRQQVQAPADAIDSFQWRVFDTARAVIAMLPEELTKQAPAIPDGPGAIDGYGTVQAGAMQSVLSVPLADIAAVARQITALRDVSASEGTLGGGPGSCAHNLRQLIVYCFITAADHDNAFPESWEALAERLDDEQRALLPGLLQCPMAGDEETPSYELIPVGRLGETPSPSTTVVIREINANHNGKRWVAFLDGHVELQE